MSDLNERIKNMVLYNFLGNDKEKEEFLPVIVIVVGLIGLVFCLYQLF